MSLYQIELTGVKYTYATIEVEAEDEDTARQIALEEVRASDWDTDDDVENVGVDSVEMLAEALDEDEMVEEDEIEVIYGRNG